MFNQQKSSHNWIRVSENPVASPDMQILYDVFSEFSLPPGIILACLSEALTGNVDGVPELVGLVYGRILDAVVRMLDVDVSCYKVELWSNRVHQVGPDVDYHLDVDERIRANTGAVCTPDYGVIFYVGPDGRELGGTYFNPPLADAGKDARLFKHPAFSEVVSEAGIWVSFRPGRLVVFDGRCPHCVAPFPYMPNPRVAILANLWLRDAYRRPVGL
jgi:hypothetical protein